MEANPRFDRESGIYQRLRSRRDVGDDSLGSGLSAEVCHLSFNACLIPAKFTGHRLRSAACDRVVIGGHLSRRQQRNAAAAQQRVANAPRLLMACSEDDLGEQIGRPVGHDWLRQLAALLRSSAGLQAAGLQAAALECLGFLECVDAVCGDVDAGALLPALAAADGSTR